MWPQFWGAPGGPSLGGREMLPSAVFQAFAAWQWWNFCGDQVPAGKALLRINLDETSVCFFQGSGKGTIIVDKKRARPMQNVSRAKRRRCLTHVAFVCDRPDLQPLLPQYIIGNESTFLVASLPALECAKPPCVTLIRQKSAWNNGLMCARIIRRLGVVLRPYVEELQPILLLDAVKLHTTKEVLAACRAAKIWPILVPAKLTWLLQPLDTDAFLPYKNHLRRAYQEARARSADGDLSIGEFLACVYDSVRRVLQGHSWGPAFDRNGFGRAQAGVSAHVQRHLQVEGPMHIPATRPTLDQLSLCFPKRTKVPTAALWRHFDRAPVAAAGSPPCSCGPAASAEPGVREPRTRAEHRRVARATAAASAGSAAAASGAPRAVARDASHIPMLD